MRFKVRHAPIPAKGSPWPMPRSYLPTKTTFLVVPGDFHFRMVGGESCAILEQNFKRISSNMFGDFDDEEMKFEPESDIEHGQRGRARTAIRWLNVTVLKECTEFPYLEMDESCKLFKYLMMSLSYALCLFYCLIVSHCLIDCLIHCLHFFLPVC